MRPMNWNGMCAAPPAGVCVADLDDDLDRTAQLTDDERSAIWLYAWVARDVAARAAHFAAV